MNFVRYILLFISISAAPGIARSANQQSAVRIPDKILSKVDSIYPCDKTVEWIKKHRRYTANFICNELNVSITFSREGEILNCIQEIHIEDVPQKIRINIEKYYPFFKIVMIEKAQRRKKEEYDIEIVRGKIHYILNYYATGFLNHQYEIDKVDWSARFVN